MQKFLQNNSGGIMKKVMYALYDKKASLYDAPFLEVADSTAIRTITDLMMKKPDSVFSTYSDDFSLYKIGYYQDSTGTPEPAIDGAQLVVELSSLKPTKE